MLSPKAIIGGVATIIVTIALLLFGVSQLLARRDANEDARASDLREEAKADREASQRMLQSAVEILARVDSSQKRDSIFDVETARRLSVLGNAYDRLSRNVAGGGTFQPDPSQPGDSAETVGPRTLALIDDQRGVIARKDTTIARRDTTILDLRSAADQAIGAYAKLDTAYQKKSEEADIYRHQRYGWRDWLSVGPGYGLYDCPPEVIDRRFCHGWNVSATITIIRPLRLIPKFPRWLGG